MDEVDNDEAGGKEQPKTSPSGPNENGGGHRRIKAPPFPSIITSMGDLKTAAAKQDQIPKGKEEEEEKKEDEGEGEKEKTRHVPHIHFMPAAQRDLPPGTPPPQSGGPHSESLPAPPTSPLLSAPRPQRKRNVSLLTAAINKRKSVLSNPLAAEFGIVSGKGDPNALELRMFFPHSEEPDLPMSILVKGDAIVEDIIGFAMYMYVDEKRKPLLDLESYGVVCWNLRIVEDDGEIDDDFPALERTRQIHTFGSLEFAIERASPAQKKMNEMGYKARLAIKEANGILKPPLPIPGQGGLSALSAGMAKSGKGMEAEGGEGAVGGNGALPPSSSLNPASAAHPEEGGGGESTRGTVTLSAEAMASLAAAKAGTDNRTHRFIKVHFHTQLMVARTTTLNVPLNMLVGEVLLRVCDRWRLSANEHILKYSDTKVEAPLDRTLSALPGLHELDLVKRGARMSCK